MDLITTHTNADFDALASMVAARKLYPHAKLVLPGSQERAVREFMSLGEDLIKIEYEKDVSLENVDRLILVETRLKDRIGKMGHLIGRKGVEVYIYDHHPKTKEDIITENDVYKRTGATTTILAELIKERDINITPLEATIMALGIYEDTGSLTFPTTTKTDIDMVSFLVSKGADLNLVSSYLRRELTTEELKLLAELIESTEIHTINGVHVAIAAAISEKYVEDLSLLAYKLEEVENYNVIFIMVQSKDKIQFIARSRLPFVDVAKIAAIFGGGGHHSAAGAIIRDSRLGAVKNALISYLRSHMHPNTKAKDIVSLRFIELGLNESVSHAKKRIIEADIEYAVVRNKNKIIGVISLKDLDKAISRGFGHSRVKGYMVSKELSVKPDTPIYHIQNIMYDNNIGCLPVKDGGKLLGVITRSAVLRALHGRSFEEETQPASSDRHLAMNLAAKIKKTYPKKIARLLRFIGKMADDRGFAAFAVGGFVRDLILGVENFDIDIVIEADAIEFAKLLAKALKGSYFYHKRFGTATVIFPCRKSTLIGKLFCEQMKIDLAMTRTEVYERPAALPTVKFGPIENDLLRRDFTINAMAFKLNSHGFGELLDPFKGRLDLKQAKIRALHDLSFVDDPTRIFRAVRFEQRFDFKIEPHTEELIKKAVGLQMIDRTQKQRIREEIVAILSEDKPLKAVRRLSELNELRFINKNLRFDLPVVHLFNSVDEALMWFDTVESKRKRSLDRWLIYFMALIDKLGVSDAIKICDDFVFKKADAAKLVSLKRNAEKPLSYLGKKDKMPPSQIYDSLNPFSHEILIYLIARSSSQTSKRRIMAYLTKYAKIKLSIRGDVFTKRGIKPGPHFKEMMKKTLYAKLDSKVKTKSEELSFAIKHLKRIT